MASVLKTEDLQGSGGSNPSPSASKNLNRTLGLGSFSLFVSAFLLLHITSSNRLYKELLDASIITQEEFEKKKQEILNS